MSRNSDQTADLLAHEDLQPALERLTEQVADRSGLDIHLHFATDAQALAPDWTSRANALRDSVIPGEENSQRDWGSGLDRGADIEAHDTNWNSTPRTRGSSGQRGP